MSLRLAKQLLLSFLLVVAPAFAFSQTAHEAVQASTDVLLEKLIEVQPLYESDPEKFFSEVEGALDPYIDFESFAKGVMAKHYRTATPEQRQQFEAAFREALIRTYAKALVEFDNQEVVVLAADGPDDGDKAVVKLEVHGSSGAVYPIAYQMIRKEDQWLLRNVAINGINIGLQFRGQFASFMQRYKRDIDKVIENWSVDV